MEEGMAVVAPTGEFPSPPLTLRHRSRVSGKTKGGEADNGKDKVYVVSVSMGYGHDRAAHNLRGLAQTRVVDAGTDNRVAIKERRLWNRFCRSYALLSRVQGTPLLAFLWKALDALQTIPPLYPHRDLSRPNLPAIYTRRLVVRKGLGRSLVERARLEGRPLLATFYAVAIAAAEGGVEDVYCVPTDSDINRVWVPCDPRSRRIRYLAPTKRCVRRLLQYGVSPEDIFLTGFPLPEENIGGGEEVIKGDLARRLKVLDPRGVFSSRHAGSLARRLGIKEGDPPVRPPTLVFTIGGAGAQSDIGGLLLARLREQIVRNGLRLVLFCGTHRRLAALYQRQADRLGLGEGIRIIATGGGEELFGRFNRILRDTDILWTKPSELSFYSALGIPIIMSPALGPQERMNAEWLALQGAGIPQRDPRHADEWIFDLLETGDLAEAAWSGFLRGTRSGTADIRRVVLSRNREQVRRELQGGRCGGRGEEER